MPSGFERGRTLLFKEFRSRELECVHFDAPIDKIHLLPPLRVFTGSTRRFKSPLWRPHTASPGASTRVERKQALG